MEDLFAVEMQLFIALFNTQLGLANIDKNNEQYDMQKHMQTQLEKILSKLDEIERRL